MYVWKNNKEKHIPPLFLVGFTFVAVGCSSVWIGGGGQGCCCDCLC